TDRLVGAPDGRRAGVQVPGQRQERPGRDKGELLFAVEVPEQAIDEGVVNLSPGDSGEVLDDAVGTHPGNPSDTGHTDEERSVMIPRNMANLRVLTRDAAEQVVVKFKNTEPARRSLRALAGSAVAAPSESPEPGPLESVLAREHLRSMEPLFPE